MTNNRRWSKGIRLHSLSPSSPLALPSHISTTTLCLEPFWKSGALGESVVVMASKLHMHVYSLLNMCHQLSVIIYMYVLDPDA